MLVAWHQYSLTPTQLISFQAVFLLSLTCEIHNIYTLRLGDYDPSLFEFEIPTRKIVFCPYHVTSFTIRAQFCLLLTFGRPSWSDFHFSFANLTGCDAQYLLHNLWFPCMKFDANILERHKSLASTPSRTIPTKHCLHCAWDSWSSWNYSILWFNITLPFIAVIVSFSLLEMTSRSIVYWKFLHRPVQFWIIMNLKAVFTNQLAIDCQ
jgi:hypothetical protein